MSKLYGEGIIKSIALVFRHFFATYGIDFRDRFQRKSDPEKTGFRSSSRTDGLFTIEYPEVKLAVPSAFRYLPFLVYDESEDGERKQRCTACGTCARACPPQCIWIVRENDQETGKPLRTPSAFTIDADMCMNCGLCAEVCPFDAIHMDHDFEIASTSRAGHIMDLDRLSKPASYLFAIKGNEQKPES